MSAKNFVIVGATGNVGRKVVELILQRNIAKASQLKLLASQASAGLTLALAGHDFSIEATTDKAFSTLSHNDICLFNTEGEISAEFVPHALASGAYVIDSSSHYRLHNNVPLIVPPVNQHLVTLKQKHYALANCLASPISVAIAPLHHHFGVKKINAVTYQSTSGAGKKPMEECWYETQSIIEQRSFSRKHFSRQIAFNIIPQVGSILDNGFSVEEYKIIHEVRKVIDDSILVTATAVRVPVMIGHSIALTLELNNDFTTTQVQQVLKKARNIIVCENHYATPVEIVGSDDVFVGRIRRDPSQENSLHLWLCSDNLRRGASVDAVETLSTLCTHIDTQRQVSPLLDCH